MDTVSKQFTKQKKRRLLFASKVYDVLTGAQKNI
jgi:hypothetical protein